jgi:hypothetical protein
MSSLTMSITVTVSKGEAALWMAIGAFPGLRVSLAGDQAR